MKQKVWNHNFAYHNWIINHTKNKNKILDVGCGDGTLEFCLANDNNDITGLDIDADILSVANKKNKNKNVRFIYGNFLEYDFKEEKYDSIVFVASIHHMDMEKAIIKSKQLLDENGIILIVGLAQPSNVIDWIIEVFRILPSKIISKLKHIKTSENLSINVKYEIPTMGTIRNICNKEFKKYKIRYGLHYRYLLYWIKK